MIASNFIFYCYICNVAPKRYNYDNLVCYDLIAAEEMQDSIPSMSRDAVESNETLDLETCWVANGNWMQGKSNFATCGATTKGSRKVGCKHFKK
jgi:hypothetical protein